MTGEEPILLNDPYKGNRPKFQALQGMDITELYSPNFDRTKHGSLFLSKVTIVHSSLVR